MSAVKIDRRALLRTAAAVAASGIPWPISGQTVVSKEGTVRDRLWLFGAPPNSDYPSIGRRSLMTPAEGAFYLGVPNVLMNQSSGAETKYGEFEPPFDQYTIALQPFRRVIWSVVGSGGRTSPEERAQVLQMAKRTPNFAGVYMDDFFTGKKEGKRAALTVDEVRAIREQLRSSGKHLELFATLYTRELSLPLSDYLNLIDVIVLWSWKPGFLANLEQNLELVEKSAPRARKILGCYFVDYDNKTTWPVSGMQTQCELGLRWLQSGRIQGIMFLGNTVEDLGYEAVEWTRRWIQKVGDLKA